MATRSLKVEFVPVGVLDSVTPEPQIHAVPLDESIDGAPEVLENPHVDFPGTWRLVGEGAHGAHRYEQVARVAETNNTLEG